MGSKKVSVYTLSIRIFIITLWHQNARKRGMPHNKKFDLPSRHTLCTCTVNLHSGKLIK